MSRNPKQPQGRELEDSDEDDTGAPRIEEQDVDDEERALQTLDKTDKHAEREQEVDDDDIIEDIDIDDLDAMEGPDA